MVQQGECLSSIAAIYGMRSWRALFDDPANSKLKNDLSRRPGILAPGDEVSVPDPPRKSLACDTERRHRFTMPASTCRLRVRMLDPQGKPHAGKRFVVTVNDADVRGTTASNGMIDVPVPARATSARLQMWLEEDPDDPTPHVDRELAIGWLDPVETMPGVQGRLANLGYACFATGEADDLTEAAVRAFRADRGLPEVSRPDPSAPEGDPDAPRRRYWAELLDRPMLDGLADAHEMGG